MARVKLANVLGISASTAVKRLRDDGFQPVVRSVFSTKPQGVVAAQKPAPGTTACQGRGGDPERLEGPARQACA